MVNLGPAYGRVRVAGMSVDESAVAVQNHLSQILRHPEVSLRLAQATGVQPVNGVYWSARTVRSTSAAMARSAWPA